MTLDTTDLTALTWDFEQRIRLGAPQYAEFLRDLVRLDTGPSCVAGIREAGTLLASRLAHSGFSFEPLPVPDGEPGPWLGVQARDGGRAGGVLIVGRLDTRWPGGTAQSWPFTVSHGVAMGPGIGEMKGGLVTAVAALEALDAAHHSGPELVVFLLLANGDLSPDARALVRDAARMADWAASLESPDAEAAPHAITRPLTSDETALYSAASTIAAELGIEDYAVPSPEPHAAGAAAATTGIPVLTSAGPVAKGRATRDESIDFETLFPRAALLATLIAAYDPRTQPNSPSND